MSGVTLAPLGSLPESDPALLAAIGDSVRARLDANPRAHRIGVPALDVYAVIRFVSSAECAALIALIDAGVKPSTSLYADGKPGSRTSETCHLPSSNPLVASIEQRICDFIGQPLSHSETVQGQRYLPGQRFSLHNDYFAAGYAYSGVAAAEGGQRTWTAMAYLDRPDGGGQTRFPFVQLEVPPTSGMLLVWNNVDRDGLPNGYSRHEGVAVEAGVKHVLTKWFREREWHSSDASNALRR